MRHNIANQTKRMLNVIISLNTFVVYVIIWIVLFLLRTGYVLDKHTIRRELKYNYKYGILLDKLRNGEYYISFWIWIHSIQGRGVNHPYCGTF